MSESLIYTVIILVSIIAVALGYTLSALRSRIQIEKLREKYVELNSRLDKEKTQTSEKFSSVEKIRHDIEQKLSDITPEEIVADLPANKDKFARVMLKPLQDTLKSADQQVKSLAREGKKSTRLIQRQIDILRAPLQLGRGGFKEIANNLGDVDARKHWGLKTAKELLEITYMTDHYRAYSGNEGEEKQDDQPTCTIQLTDGRKMALDTNAPLEPYVNICQAPDASIRDWHSETHARKLRERIMAMSSRAYLAHFEHAPEIMILLVLNDHYLTAALEVDADLLQVAESQKVVLATPTDLLTLLQAISFDWQHHRFAKDALKMRQTGLQLYRDFGTFIKLIAELGSELSGVLNSYNRAVTYFEKEAPPEEKDKPKQGFSSPASKNIPPD